MDFFGPPFRRGFFCDDDSIRYPNKHSTVSTFTAYFTAISCSVALVLYGEYVEVKRAKNTGLLARWRKTETGLYYSRIFRTLICYGNGLLHQYLITEVAKFVVGRLRPNFIAVCGLDIDKVCQNRSHEYITDYRCRASEDVVNNSRISFPSGHACASFYSAIFIVLYIQKRMKTGTLFWKPNIQFCVLLVAWFVSMSRIMDYQHHYSDVVAGIVIGSVVAIVNTVFFHGMFNDAEPASSSYVDISNENASETRGLLRNDS